MKLTVYFKIEPTHLTNNKLIKLTNKIQELVYKKCNSDDFMIVYSSYLKEYRLDITFNKILTDKEKKSLQEKVFKLVNKFMKKENFLNLQCSYS